MNVLAPDRQASLEQLLIAGHSLRDIAITIGCAKGTVERYKRRLGAQKAGRARWAKKREGQGKSVAACLVPKYLARMGSNPPSLADVLKEMGEIPEMLEEVAVGCFDDDDCGPAYLAAHFAAAEIIRYSLKA